MFIRLKGFDQRTTKESTAEAIAQQVTMASGQIEDATVFVLSPPAVQGLGNGGGFKMMIQDKSGAGYRALEQATMGMMGGAAQMKETPTGLLPLQHRLAAHHRRRRS